MENLTNLNNNVKERLVKKFSEKDKDGFYELIDATDSYTFNTIDRLDLDSETKSKVINLFKNQALTERIIVEALFEKQKCLN